MNAITLIGEVLATKDSALSDMISFLEFHRKPCEVNHHWLWCEENINPMILRLVEAMRAR